MPYTQNWSDIDALGKTKISRSSYIYIVLVPILTKAFSLIDNPVTLVIEEQSFSFDLAFPVSWYTFYFGALCIAIAATIYSLRCPEIIRKYPDYGTFMSSGRDDDYLRWIVTKFLPNDPDCSEAIEGIDRNTPTISENRTPFKFDSFGNPAYSVDYLTPRILDNPEYHISRRRAFNVIWDKSNMDRPRGRFWASTMYYLGIAAFVAIIIWNFLIVIGFDHMTGFPWL